MFRAALENHDFSALTTERVGLPLYGFLRDYIARRQNAGALRKCDPGVAVFALLALPVYFSIVTRLFGIRVVKTSEKDLLNMATDLTLNGLLASGRKPKNRAVSGRGHK